MAANEQRTGRRDAAGRWGRAVAVALGTGLAVSLAACASNNPTFTPKPVETITPTPVSSPSGAATSPSSSAPPTATPTPSAPAVKATGSLSLFMEVTKALTGTCTTVAGAPTITLADHKNDFYGTVDATLVLSGDVKSVASVDVAFGEDSEGFTWKLTYSAASPAKGTSAKLSVAGSTYAVKGKLAAVERRGSKTRNEVLPFTLVAKCASNPWRP